MQHLRLSLSLLALAAIGTAQAQNVNPKLLAPAKRFNVGLKAGTGFEYIDPNPSAPPKGAPVYYTAGPTFGYLVTVLGVTGTVQADVLLTRRAANPWDGPSEKNASLFVPVYVRTGLPARRVHYLLGAGPTVWVAGRTVPGRVTGRYATHPFEATGFAGIEARILPLGTYETTLALTYRRSFSPSLIEYRDQPGGPAEAHAQRFSWLGVTLNVYLHQPVRPQ